MATRQDVTQHLADLERGDQTAVDRLFPLVYGDLRRLAASYFRGRGNQTLQPTALVHEAYARLVGHQNAGWSDRRHFFSVAAMAMRQILADHARARGAVKRGGDKQRVAIDESNHPALDMPEVDLIALDEALTRLAELDERQARIVELRFLAGLTVDETADILGVSPRTVRLDWQMSRAFLREALQEADDR